MKDTHPPFAGRLEDRRFLTGAGRYVDDITLGRQCHMALVLSTHAHAEIRSIDTSTAETMPGVIAVLTGADVLADGLGPVPGAMSTTSPWAVSATWRWSFRPMPMPRSGASTPRRPRPCPA
jgi:CO/xanthine dehydrogenase Mo-binding subunit